VFRFSEYSGIQWGITIADNGQLWNVSYLANATGGSNDNCFDDLAAVLVR